MLHVMLRMGLRDDLKDISGHKYDSVKDFNKLRNALRQQEKDYKNPTKPITAKAAIASPDQDELFELKGMVQQLTTTELQGKHQQQFRGNNFRFILEIVTY